MNNKKKYLSLVLILIILLTTGCGANNYIKEKRKEII